MSKKRIYSAVDVERVDVAAVVGELADGCVVAVDVAKTKFVAAVATRAGEVVRIVRFDHPRQTRTFLALLDALRAAGVTPVIVMEPTGTYGDVVAWQCRERGFEVRMVAPKHTHDASEFFDGVPSMHDAKATVVLARLATVARTWAWQPRSEEQRDLRAAVARRRLYAEQLEGNYGQLEALLARHWPELGEHVDVREQRSWMALLAQLPGPAAITAAPAEAAKILRRAGRGALVQERIQGVVDSAAQTLGLPMTAAEQHRLGELVADMRRLLTELDRVDEQLRARVQQDATMNRLARVIGAVTTAVLVSYLGEIGAYACAGALEKACGLNLKERSSGEHVGKLHITKRGPGVVRHYLYLAALRLLQRDPVAAAWYQARGSYQAGARSKAVIAVTRKLARALWHVARGAEFDSRRLFDTRRLDLESGARESVTTPCGTEKRARRRPHTTAADRRGHAQQQCAGS
jgi:transposase